MPDITTALVIGGGIAGPVAAMALQKIGVDATVYEAYDSTADGTGGMLGIAPNGLHALGVIDADHVVLDTGDPVRAMVMHSWTGKRLAEFGGTGGQPVFHAIWRADLYRALYDEAVRRGIRIEHGKRLVRKEDTGTAVTAHFADGTGASADILIGADGIRSTVRSLIDADSPLPRYTGLLGVGGRLVADDIGLSSTDGAMHMFFGKRVFFAYSVTDDGRVGWFANLPRRQPMTLAQARAVDPEEWLRALSDAFAQDRTPATKIVGSVDPADLVVVGALQDLPTVPTWSHGRTVLVGDAAHATSPSSGQGASLAVESAVQLARCLRDLPVDRAFAAYEDLRRARVERVIAAGARTNSDKAAGPVARVVRDLVMPVAMKLLAKPEKMAWQYDYRIDWETPVTRSALVG